MGLSQTFSSRTLSKIPARDQTSTLEETPEPTTPEPFCKLCLNAFTATCFRLLLVCFDFSIQQCPLSALRHVHCSLRNGWRAEPFDETLAWCDYITIIILVALLLENDGEND